MTDPPFDWKDILHSGGWLGYVFVFVWGISKLIPVIQESWGKAKKTQADLAKERTDEELRVSKAETDDEIRRGEENRSSLKFLQERLEVHVIAIEKNQDGLRKEIARLEKGRSEIMTELMMERSLAASLRGRCESLQKEVNDLKVQVADLTARLNGKEIP